MLTCISGWDLVDAIQAFCDKNAHAAGHVNQHQSSVKGARSPQAKGFALYQSAPVLCQCQDAGLHSNPPLLCMMPTRRSWPEPYPSGCALAAVSVPVARSLVRGPRDASTAARTECTSYVKGGDVEGMGATWEVARTQRASGGLSGGAGQHASGRQSATRCTDRGCWEKVNPSNQEADR